MHHILLVTPLPLGTKSFQSCIFINFYLSLSSTSSLSGSSLSAIIIAYFSFASRSKASANSMSANSSRLIVGWLCPGRNTYLLYCCRKSSCSSIVSFFTIRRWPGSSYSWTTELGSRGALEWRLQRYGTWFKLSLVMCFTCRGWILSDRALNSLFFAIYSGVRLAWCFRISISVSTSLSYSKVTTIEYFIWVK